MLVLTRKVGEAIMIGDNIEIIVTEINGDKVKLAVNASKEIAILRKELLELKAANQEAVSQNADLTKLQKISSLQKNLKK